jgi:hypothetical protein
VLFEGQRCIGEQTISSSWGGVVWGWTLRQMGTFAKGLPAAESASEWHRASLFIAEVTVFLSFPAQAQSQNSTPVLSCASGSEKSKITLTTI